MQVRAKQSWSTRKSFAPDFTGSKMPEISIDMNILTV